MKKVIMIMAVLLFVVSCNKDDQESFFDNTATERMKANKDEFFKSLNSSNWVIELFPAKDQRFGGYSVGADFNEDYTVKLWNEFGVHYELTDKSTSYDIISRDGSTLTFNEFNRGVHLFSDPKTMLPNGLEADYEFTYLKKEGNTIFTTGTKTRNDIRLIEIKGTPKEYLLKILEFKEVLKNTLKGKVLGVTKPANAEFKLLNFKKDRDDRLFEYIEKDGGEVKTMAIVYRPNGFRMYKPINIGGNEISEFVLNDTKDKLISGDGSVELAFETPMINFDTGEHAMLFRDGMVSPTLLALYEKAKAQNTLEWNENLNDFLIINTYSKELVFFMMSGRYPIRHMVSPKYYAKDEVNFLLTNPSSNWRWYGWVHPLMKTFGANSPFKIEVSDSFGDYKLTSKTNPDIWFYLVKLPKTKN